MILDFVFDFVSGIFNKKVIVIGRGLAGMVASISAAERGHKVNVYFVDNGNTMKASTGISAAINTGDVDSFKNDILKSGKNCNVKLVNILAEDSIAAIKWLKKHGVNLNKPNQDSNPAGLVKTGGHSVARTYVITGAEILKSLNNYIERHGLDITFLNGTVKSLIKKQNRVVGVRVGDKDEYADAIVMATGGYSGRYADDNNLPTTNGEYYNGIQIAKKAGAGCVGMNDIQIHPTGFVDPADTSSRSKILAPEKMRAVGGILLIASGERFVDELATRDVITNKISALKNKEAYLVLDTVSMKRFGHTINYYIGKGLFQKMNNGDIYATVTPVVHYTMGGVRIDEHARALDTHGNVIPGLFIVGELAGGIHGKNRLCGGSLLDCVVFGLRANNLI